MNKTVIFLLIFLSVSNVMGGFFIWDMLGKYFGEVYDCFPDTGSYYRCVFYCTQFRYVCGSYIKGSSKCYTCYYDYNDGFSIEYD